MTGIYLYHHRSRQQNPQPPSPAFSVDFAYNSLTMAQAATATNAGSTPLQSKDHRDLLDIVDLLRSKGLSRFVDLPQIIVCGDQSSGKSSALEAISGMSFPSKDNLCTRFATELILRRAPEAGVDICIIPGPERSDEEKQRLVAFGYTGTTEGLDIGPVVDDAKSVMGLNGNTKAFSTDILRIEISGPLQPHLTMVDLPGLFLAGNKDQSQEDAALVKALVLSYMKKPRTIILAVVSAKSDFALQQVTQHARALDPKGIRTLGLITKPDTLDQGSDSERFYVELAQNKDVKFHLGWHVLRNRNYAERGDSTAGRDTAEADFFSNGIWTSLKPTQLGVAALRVRLSQVLHNQILKQLPGVLTDVTAGRQDCQHTLARLGTARAGTTEQRRYLLAISARFSSLVGAAVDGTYTDAFFRAQRDKRLRAVVQNTLTDFAEDMRLRGHAIVITEDRDINDNADDGNQDTNQPRCISRSAYIKEVKALMKESRGRELPGTYNPLIVTELFSEQCKPWQGKVRSLVDRVFNAASITIESILQHIADGQTAEALLHAIVRPTMENIKKELTGKTDETMEPYISGHPITYNHYLTDNVQKAQARRSRQQLEERLKSFFDMENLPYNNAVYCNPLQLLNNLAAHVEPDMDTYSCSIAIDMMEAYYLVWIRSPCRFTSPLC